MRRFYQKQWFGIPFETFAELDPDHLADAPFYDAFYQAFFQKFAAYDAIPIEWREEKQIIVNHLLEMLNDKQSVLSIGCGIGYIERQIASSDWNGKLTAIEPSVQASKWIKEAESLTFYNGYFPEALPENCSFDLAYTSYVDYVFDEEEYIVFLKEIVSYGIKDFVIVGASVYEEGLLATFKACTKALLVASKLYNPGQLWGYQRSIDEHLHAFKLAGFQQVEHGKLPNNTFWFRGKNA